MFISRFLKLNQQHVDNIKLKFQTPIYIFDEIGVMSRLTEMQQLAKHKYPKSLIAISYKTNPIQALLKKFHQQGAFAEVVSGEEYAIAKRLNVKDENIIFNGPMKTDDELITAIKNNVMINCDHEDEINRIKALASELNKKINIGLRVTFKESTWHRFGFSPEEIFVIIDKLNQNQFLTIKGLHCHLGTNIRDIKQFKMMAKNLNEFALELYQKKNITLSYLDVGGGLAGISPTIEEKQDLPHELPSLNDYLNTIIGELQPYLTQCQPTLFFEPGRTIFEPYAALLTDVVGLRPATPQDYPGIICNAGFNFLATANVYNYPIHVAQEKKIKSINRLYGPTCNQADQLHQPIALPNLKRGDWILFYGVGAYCMSFSFSFIRYRPGVLLWQPDDQFKLIRLPENLQHISRLET